MDNLLNKIFPPKCLFCEEYGEILCENCLSKCELVNNQVCLVCDCLSKEGFTHKKCFRRYIPTRYTTVYKYKNLVRECIRKSKYYQKHFMALKTLSFEACCLLRERNFEIDSNFIIVPIPISKKREEERGFNQAEVISNVFAKFYKLKLQNSILIRKKDTKVQHSLGRQARFLNLDKAFTANKGKVKGKKFLVVDDISTTGATLLEASKELYLAGAKEVQCFSLCKKEI